MRVVSSFFDSAETLVRVAVEQHDHRGLCVQVFEKVDLSCRHRKPVKDPPVQSTVSASESLLYYRNHDLVYDVFAVDESVENFVAVL